ELEPSWSSRSDTAYTSGSSTRPKPLSLARCCAARSLATKSSWLGAAEPDFVASSRGRPVVPVEAPLPRRRSRRGSSRASDGSATERRSRAPPLERVQRFFLLCPGCLRQLGGRRGASGLHGQLLDEPRELDVELLQAARHTHRPALVAEVALDLADDVRRRIRRQLDAALEVETVDRLDQSDRADLDEILQLLAAVRVPPRERADERHVLL